MNLIEEFVSKFEQQHKIIGQVECDSEETPKVLLGIMKSMGMSNPSQPVKSSAKGIKIVKKGDKYTLILYMFTPPINITWTRLTPISKIIDYINIISKDKKVLGYVNLYQIAQQQTSFQFAESY